MVTCVALFPQLSLLEDAGFGGVLVYTDPCDLPKTADLADKAFMVSLNSGGDPSTPGYASIGKYWSGLCHWMCILILCRFVRMGVKTLNQILLEREALSKEILCNTARLKGWNPVSKVL